MYSANPSKYTDRLGIRPRKTGRLPACRLLFSRPNQGSGTLNQCQIALGNLKGQFEHVFNSGSASNSTCYCSNLRVSRPRKRWSVSRNAFSVLTIALLLLRHEQTATHHTNGSSSLHWHKLLVEQPHHLP